MPAGMPASGATRIPVLEYHLLHGGRGHHAERNSSRMTSTVTMDTGDTYDRSILALPGSFKTDTVTVRISDKKQLRARMKWYVLNRICQREITRRVAGVDCQTMMACSWPGSASPPRPTTRPALRPSCRAWTVSSSCMSYIPLAQVRTHCISVSSPDGLESRLS